MSAEEQCVEPSFEGDKRWRRDDVRWQAVPKASCRDCDSAVSDVCIVGATKMQDETKHRINHAL